MTSMKAFIARDFGRVVGAWWAPEESGTLGAGEVATAFLGLDGKAVEYTYTEFPRYDKRGRQYTVRERTGKRPLEDAEIISALQAAIVAAMQADQREADARAAYQSAPRDEWGNPQGQE